MADSPFGVLPEIFDVFFNERPCVSRSSKPKVTIEEIVRRGVSHVSLGGKIYRVEAKEVEITK